MRSTFKTVFYVNASKEKNGETVWGLLPKSKVMG